MFQACKLTQIVQVLKTPSIAYFVVYATFAGTNNFVNFTLSFRLFNKAKNWFKTPKVDAASLDETNQDLKSVDVEEENESELKPSKKKKVGFRERKIIEYENRIRHYSTP